MFSYHQRCHYSQSQLAEVICQLRFPQILKINTQCPDTFQELIRDRFPVYTSANEYSAPKFTGIPGNFHLEAQQTSINHQFATEKGDWRINLTDAFISLSCTKYTNWESFANHLDQPLAAFIQTYQPAYFTRIGLRYMNFISRRDLTIEDMPFSALIQPAYLGILAEDDVVETAATRCNVDAELTIPGGNRAKIHAGPGMVKKNGQPDNEVKFIFDMDLFASGNTPVTHAPAVLEDLHKNSFSIFRNAITTQLHNAMEPEEI